MSNLATHIDTHFLPKRQEALHDYLKDKIGKKYNVTLAIARRELTLTVPRQNLLAVLRFLKTDRKYGFSQLVDLCGVDWLEHKPQAERFAVVYHLLSLAKNQRVRVVTHTAGPARHTNPSMADTRLAEPVPSAAALYPNATWYERETWDMYGIPFEGNTDMRRLLTDYDFVGHPLRKDFPLNGYTEVYFDAQQNRVAHKPVDLPQAFRHFDKTSPWQGMAGPVPLADEDNTFTREEFEK